MKIAVANVRMSEEDIKAIFKGDTRDISKRCQEIGRILNEAIRYKADILVFPEAYIPLEYLKILQTKVAEHNMVIIGGIEHIPHGNLVYNLTTTILPIKIDICLMQFRFSSKIIFFTTRIKDSTEKWL